MQSIIDILFHHGLIWHEAEHSLFALPFAILLYYKTKPKNKVWKYIGILFFVAYFLDLDHLFDYFVYYGFHFSLLDFFRMKYFTPGAISLVPFHGWEWVLILGYLAQKKKWKTILTPIVFGMLSHVILDAFNVESVLFYSIVFRMSRLLNFI